MTAVSVFLPTYSRNKDGMLARSIASVLDGSFTDFELLVCDDGSTDGSAQTIAEFAARDPRVKHIRFDKNVGLPAMTTGIAAQQMAGEFVAWQFDDCVWRPNHLTRLVERLRSNHEADFAHAGVEVHFLAGPRLLNVPLDRAELLKGHNHIANAATIGRRSAYDDVGWVDPHLLLKKNNDWDLWVRASATHKFSHVDEILAEEFGPSLSSSLGNSVTSQFALSSRYARLPRAERLKISRLNEFDPFAIPTEIDLSDDEARTFAFLLIEHFASRGEVSAAPAHLAKLKQVPPEIASLAVDDIVRLLLAERSAIFHRTLGDLDERMRKQHARIIELGNYVNASRLRRLAGHLRELFVRPQRSTTEN